MIRYVATIAGIIVLGIAAIFARLLWFRILLWILAVPFFLLGLLAIVQGGIADAMSPQQMLKWCALMFWPMIGCIAGLVLNVVRRKHRQDE